VSGHPLAAGRAQERESPPAKDRRSTTEPTPPTRNVTSSYSQCHSYRVHLHLQHKPSINSKLLQSLVHQIDCNISFRWTIVFGFGRQLYSITTSLPKITGLQFAGTKYSGLSCWGQCYNASATGYEQFMQVRFEKVTNNGS